MNIKGKQMPRIDADELDVVTAFDQGQLKSVATKGELAKLKAAARATARPLIDTAGEVLSSSLRKKLGVRG